jgi:hypothetical protein
MAATSTGVWLTIFDICLWLQTSHSDNGQGRVGITAAHLGGQALEEVELVVELGVQRAIGNVAAGRDVEVLNLDPGHLG